MKMFARLWRDDAGSLLAAEWVMLATLLVIGIVAGLKAVQSAVNNELEEVASALGALSQSYSVGGTSGCCASTGGSFYSDTPAVYPVTTCTPVTPQEAASCPD